MSRPTRDTLAGRAYLDLQNRARAERRGTQELLTLYVVERWLARLSASRYADQFVLKGGILLAAFDARRPTADADALARNFPNDEDAVMAHVVEIASQSLPGDGIEFRTDTVTSRVIRDEDLYSGVRITMDCAIATAMVKLRLDINFGDPITPAPQLIDLPALRPDDPPVRVLGYPLETVLAEKIATAIALGPVNTPRARLRGRLHADRCAVSDPRRGTRSTACDRKAPWCRGHPAIDGDREPDRATSRHLRCIPLWARPRRSSSANRLRDRRPSGASFADGLIDEAQSSSRWDHTVRRWNS